MAHKFAQTLFTPSVKAAQKANGSFDAYRRFESDDAPPHDTLGPDETDFIKARDSFYMASISQSGWPYIQHRGGPPGFIRVLDSKTIGFADFRGNRQYISTGNFHHDPRVAIIMIDYVHQARLKIIGRMEIIEASADQDKVATLMPANYRAMGERAMILHVEAFDWNCPKHITQRFSQDEVASALAPMRDQMIALEERNKKLKALVKSLTVRLGEPAPADI
jgi:predicted pyridoxine 5'-phosphate oxidase superfamily flavin-nucleotide-binding protein